MCSENSGGVIAGLIVAAAILAMAFAEKHSGAHAVAPVHHTISAPATRVAIAMPPLTLDIDLAHARVSLGVSL